MTDTIQNDQTDTQTTDTAPASTFKIGDRGQIGRGRNAGDPGVVIAVNPADGTLAVQLDSGAFTIVKSSNFREPGPAFVEVADVVTAYAADGIEGLAALLDSREAGQGAALLAADEN